MDLWTQRFRASYAPTLNFFERRYEILRVLEKQGLQSFDVDEDGITAHLADAQHRLSFGPQWVAVALLRKDGDIAAIHMGLETVLNMIEPRALIRPHFRYQWLWPIDRPYNEARRAAAETLLSPIEGLFDFALVGDGSWSDPPGSYRVECGVVEQAEIALRFGDRGSYLAPPDESLPPTLWSPETLPEVAFYSHFVWRSEDSLNPSMEDVTTLWEGSQRASESVMSALVGQVAPRFETMGSK